MDREVVAQNALQQMLNAGFDQAQVVVNVSEKTELNIAHDDASLLRSTEDQSLSLTGILGGRKAGVALTDLSEEALVSSVKDLLEKAKMAPVDEANTVSAHEQGEFNQGPQEADLELLVSKAQELLSFRAKETPLMSIEEGVASHQITRSLLLTSEGSSLSSSTGAYSLSAFGSAREGEKNSAMNSGGGTTNDLSVAHAADLFSLGDMFRDTEKQIDTRQFDDKFQGNVILAPEAVSDLVSWLMRQLSDMALIGKNSQYVDQVGEIIASPLLTLNSRFNGPGCDPITGDGFAAPDFTLVEKGALKSLLASHYGSKKTGLPHRPCASGWTITPGETPLDEMIAAIPKGALVNRLSMGTPGPSGDFSGVIKNSFMINEGRLGDALSETMIAGNMGAMLKDIQAISAEHMDSGSEDFPWIAISGLYFS